MDIKILPAITFPIVNDRAKKNKTTVPIKKRIKAKVIDIRPARKNENGKTIITLITDEHYNIIQHLNKKEVIISTE
ncbi:hypothetical protein [Deferribacter desulfuricans]|uniref:hypothetical protein n=1 Tax=Deferribacter desulfuricans TaxID=197162 RepID=UPI0002D52AC3|nr:hypothetical protein [Deferribacter desulfuricans]